MSKRPLGFNGGPWDEDEPDGLFAKTITWFRPPFFCLNADGRYEHYVMVEDCPDHEVCYEHAGACRDRSPHEDCGHEHN